MGVIFWSEKIAAKNTLVLVRGSRPGNIYLLIYLYTVQLSPSNGTGNVYTIYERFWKKKKKNERSKIYVNRLNESEHEIYITLT